MIATLVRNWWAFVLRGVCAILFGMLALSHPQAAILSLTLVFAIYAFVGGVLTVFAAISTAVEGGHWVMLALEGVVSIVAGIVAVTMPGLTVTTFVILLGISAVLSGVLTLAAAWKLEGAHGRWWLVAVGIASLLYGALLLFAPLTGAVVLTWWIAIYAILAGIALIVFGLRLRGLRHAGAR